MRKYCMTPFISLVVICIGCSSANKLRVPLAEIDRPIVDPKGTWSVKPSLTLSVFTQDTFASRGGNVGNLIVPRFGYSLTDNLSLPYIPFPYLVWQLTKSPLVDTTERYKWQCAISGGMNGYNQLLGVTGDIQFYWKKRLFPSVWYLGEIYCPWGDIFHRGMWEAAQVPQVINGVGFQLSQKADVVTRLSVAYFGNYLSFTTRDFSGVGNLTFHYSFSPWFSINFGSSLEMRKGAMGMSMNIGNEFYW